VDLVGIPGAPPQPYQFEYLIGVYDKENFDVIFDFVGMLPPLDTFRVGLPADGDHDGFGIQVSDLSPVGFTPSYEGDCDANGRVILVPGQLASCTVTHSFVPFVVPGEPPVVVADTATTYLGVVVNVDVAANDSDPDDDLLDSSVTVVTDPINGSASPNGDGTVSYFPDPTFLGTDFIIYGICDTTGLCNLGMVTIEVKTGVLGPKVIAPPSDVTDTGASNLQQQAFHEAQNVILPRDVEVDGIRYIDLGVCVSSYMIFLNPPAGQSVAIEDLDVQWTFEKTILGIMSNRSGTREANSTDILGAAGTIYPMAFPARGLELSVNEGYAISGMGDLLTLSMKATVPGDWIRVVTQCDSPPGG
jgi:hypothetical protein